MTAKKKKTNSSLTRMNQHCPSEGRAGVQQRRKSVDDNQKCFTYQFILCVPKRAYWHNFSVILSKIKINLKIKVKLIYRSLDVSERVDSKILVLTCVFQGNLEPK